MVDQRCALEDHFSCGQKAHLVEILKGLVPYQGDTLLVFEGGDVVESVARQFQFEDVVAPHHCDLRQVLNLPNEVDCPVLFVEDEVYPVFLVHTQQNFPDEVFLEVNGFPLDQAHLLLLYHLIVPKIILHVHVVGNAVLPNVQTLHDVVVEYQHLQVIRSPQLNRLVRCPEGLGKGHNELGGELQTDLHSALVFLGREVLDVGRDVVLEQEKFFGGAGRVDVGVVEGQFDWQFGFEIPIEGVGQRDPNRWSTLP